MDPKKMVLTALFSGQQWRNRESRPMDTEEEGEGEVFGEDNMETYNSVCKTHGQWGFAV